MRFKFRNYFYQNEEIGADSTDGVSSGSATDEVKAPAKPEEDDTVKRTLKKLRDELNAAQALVKQKDEQLKEKERLDEEERAKRTGDFAKLKEQLLTETAAEKAGPAKRTAGCTEAGRPERCGRGKPAGGQAGDTRTEPARRQTGRR